MLWPRRRFELTLGSSFLHQNRGIKDLHVIASLSLVNSNLKNTQVSSYLRGTPIEPLTSDKYVLEWIHNG